MLKRKNEHRLPRYTETPIEEFPIYLSPEQRLFTQYANQKKYRPDEYELQDNIHGIFPMRKRF